jgi:oligoribonuclease
MSQTVNRRQDPGNLVWIDLEMTGLDPQSDVILQAALIVTDQTLQPLEEFVVDVWQPSAALEGMVPFVRTMHERTGLLKRVAASSIDLGAAERSILERVAGWCPYRPILCGNSIASDRKFIDRFMPALSGYLHYRMLDVSTLKVLAQLWYDSSALYHKPKTGEHDALFDIRESIAELRHYRKTLFLDSTVYSGKSPL